MKKPFVVAITGASGSVYGIELVKALAELGEDILLVVSPEARLVIKAELGVTLPEAEKLESFSSLFPKKVRDRIRYFDYRDIAAPPASGSFKTKGMIVCPCSQATLSAIRTGASRNLIDRAADVAIKETRPLILVPREMPLSPVHLENMLALSRMGVKILPAAPGFYHKPKSIEDLVRFVVGKVLDSAGVDHNLFKRWGSK